jgi:hypothetical protein
MTTKNLFLSLSCALALAAPAAARADDDGVDCSKYPRKELLEDLRKLVKIQRQGPCSRVDVKTLKLEGPLQPQKCEGEDCKPTDYVQNFSGKGVDGSLSVTWEHQRIGFEEWCQVNLTYCHNNGE